MSRRLDDLRSAFTAALGRGDAKAAVEAYAEDARLLLPASEPMDGRAAIEAFWRAGLASGMSGFELEPQLLNLEASFACEIGRYVLRARPTDERPVTEEGRYLVIHRQTPDGTWQRALELFAPRARRARARREAPNTAGSIHP